MIDYDRWHAVTFLHSRGIGFTNRKHGGDLDTLFDKAAQYLTGTSSGTAETIRKSYLRVQKRMKTEPWRYQVFRHIRSDLPGSTPPQRVVVWYDKRG